MQYIDPATIDLIASRISAIGVDASGVQDAKMRGLVSTEPQEHLDWSETAYRKAMDALPPEQRELLEDVFADALKAARAGRDTSSAQLFLAQTVLADTMVQEMEDRLTELKAARDRWARGAMSYDVTMYAIARACGRTQSTVQRWVK